MAISITSHSGSNSKKEEIKIIPLVHLREGVIFPEAEAVLTFGRPSSVASVKKAAVNNTEICFVSQIDPKKTDPLPQNLYKIGTVCRILKTLPVDGHTHAIVHGVRRVKIHSFRVEKSELIAAVSELEDSPAEISRENEALINNILNSCRKVIDLGKPNVDPAIFAPELGIVTLSHLTATMLDISNEKKQSLLEEIDPIKRLRLISNHLLEEIQTLQLEYKITADARKKFDKDIKENVLRQRMKSIQKELGEDEDDHELKDLKKSLKKVKLPKAIKEKVDKELSRLARMSVHNPESGYIRTWLEIVADLPWNFETKSNLSIDHAQNILNKDHYGLKKVKERIIEYIAVLKLKSERKIKNGGKTFTKEPTPPTILCFVGPPGVGKTSVGRSIARALGRKFTRISLGGIRDEAEIRGHRRTYVGALPGRIIQAIRESKSNNPVFMLDEIDKVGADYKGDPSSALLEVLDPEQNSDFRDHYLDFPYDLSKVMFVTTANVLETIPDALRDRLEVIRFSGYTENEKVAIARRHLIPKQIKANGLTSKQVKIVTETLRLLSRHYTREAGVRNLEREISTLLRKVARKIAQKKKITLPAEITTKKAESFLGPQKYSHTLIEDKNQIGISTGLAYTQTGGDILFIEVALMKGKGQLILTGQLGSVMKESAQAALSYVRSKADLLGVDAKALTKTDVHIHVPEGATPKDGPSAGLAITTALISALIKKPVDRELAMTGEVTLRGRALEIGGLKEKVIAAHRAGIKKIIIPAENKKNMIEIPSKVRKDLEFHYANNMDDVIKIVFGSLASTKKSKSFPPKKKSSKK